MKTNIALIGFMGVGKTTVGITLANKLNYTFVEIDSRIEQKYGIPLPEIFNKYGENFFREKEREAIKEISQLEYVVIDCGGGIVLNKINIVRLQRKSIIVYLTALPDDILARLQNDNNQRPLLPQQHREREIMKLMKKRNSLYDNSAELKIDTSKRDINTVVENIINELTINESFNFKK